MEWVEWETVQCVEYDGGVNELCGLSGWNRLNGWNGLNGLNG